VWRAKPSKVHFVLRLVRAAKPPEPGAKKKRLGGLRPAPPPGEFASSVFITFQWVGYGGGDSPSLFTLAGGLITYPELDTNAASIVCFEPTGGGIYGCPIFGSASCVAWPCCARGAWPGRV